MPPLPPGHENSASPDGRLPLHKEDMGTSERMGATTAAAAATMETYRHITRMVGGHYYDYGACQKRREVIGHPGNLGDLKGTERENLPKRSIQR